jgi:hypothetical protein
MITENFFNTGAPCSTLRDSALLRIERRVAPTHVSLQGTSLSSAGYVPMAQGLFRNSTSKVEGFYAESINPVRTFAADVEAISVQATTGTPRKGSALSGVRAWRPPV